MNKILLVEDDKALALALMYSLKKEGFIVDHAMNLQDARILINNDVDIILLDLILPDGDGYEFCTEIRTSKINVQIIFITACNDENNIVLGLDLGADDYVTKPVKIKELVSRINAILRRKNNFSYKENSKSLLISSDIEINKGTHIVKKNGEIIDLTLSEYKLLLLIIENAPNVLTREIMLEKLWYYEGNYIEANALNVYIKRIREKIEDDIKNSKYIGTVRGVGYKWLPKVVS